MDNFKRVVGFLWPIGNYTGLVNFRVIENLNRMHTNYLFILIPQKISGYSRKYLYTVNNFYIIFNLNNLQLTIKVSNL